MLLLSCSNSRGKRYRALKRLRLRNNGSRPLMNFVINSAGELANRDSGAFGAARCNLMIPHTRTFDDHGFWLRHQITKHGEGHNEHIEIRLRARRYAY